MSEARRKWDTVDEGTKVRWESAARSPLKKTEVHQEDHCRGIVSGPTLSWNKVAAMTGDDIIGHQWCSGSTIRRWVVHLGTYKVYAERILPYLTEEQKGKCFSFAERLLANHHLGNGKYILVHYDEKWFWSVVLRSRAKSCKEIGLDKKAFRLYHKNHIDKVMAVVVTGYAFENNIENGGTGLKLGFYRAQAVKRAQKMQRESRRDENGMLKFDGKIIWEKGDSYFSDCSVTGCNPGTDYDPKFPLYTVFEVQIFPLLEELVMPGGKYEGYIPIIQGDQAGPHEEVEFVR